MIDPRHVHLIAAKHILRYLKGTVDYGLKYVVNQKINLEGYVDSDWVVPSIGRALQVVASVWDHVFSWFSRKQYCVALSIAEAEHVTACSASCEVVWLRKLLSDLFDLQMDSTCIHCDNQSCVKLSENPMFHDKSKHIRIKCHYIRIWCRGE